MASPKAPKPTHLPSPPASPPPSDNSTAATPPANPPHLHDLETALDALLASYLTLLDRYTTLRTELSSHFSAGFLSLAAANRNAASTLGPGRRFGEEGFDGRMRALRRVSITTTPQPTHTGKVSGTDQEEAAAVAAAAADDLPDTNPDASPLPRRFSIQQHHNHRAPSPSRSPLPSTDHGQEQKDKHPPPRDPLKWYTALPPPALRQTQTHFVASLEGPLAALLGVQAEMAWLEEQVRRARRALEDARVERDRRHHEAVQAVDEGEVGEGPEPSDPRARQTQTQAQQAQKEPAMTAPSSTSSPSSSPLKGQLAPRSRGGEPRSRVLKMQ